MNGDPSGVDDLNRRVKEGVSRLRGLDTGDELRSDDQGFKTTYGRVAREIRGLESKGLVSRRLLGRDKPYRLTDYAVTNLARIGGEGRQISLVPWFDIAAYSVTIALTVVIASRAMGWLALVEEVHVNLFAVLCFFLGASCVEIVRTLRRVF